MTAPKKPEPRPYWLGPETPPTTWDGIRNLLGWLAFVLIANALSCLPPGADLP